MKYGHLLRTLSVVLTLSLGLLVVGPAVNSPDISARAAHTDQSGSPGLGVHGNTAGSVAAPDRLLSSPRSAVLTTAVAGSKWYTYANGDDILVLEMEGEILWAGTRAGGVVRWDTRDGTFVQFLKPQDRLAGNTVRDIYIDADGNKWLATDEGLSVLDDNGTPDKADDIWYTFTSWPIGSYFPSNRITAVAMDEAGFLWIGTSQYWDAEAEAYVGGGLVKIDPQGTLNPADDEWLQTYTVENTISYTHGTIILGLASDNITDILPVPGNRMWVATGRQWVFNPPAQNDPVGHWVQLYGGLSRLDHAGTPRMEDDTWQTWTCESGPQYSPEVSCTINQLQLDASGYVWAAQRGRGAIAFPHDVDQAFEPVRFDRSDGLPTNDIQSITFGPRGAPEWQNTVWISTYYAAGGSGRGVAVLDHKGTVQDKADDIWNDRTPVPGEEITTDSGLPGDRVQAMVTGGGKIWMGIGGRFGTAHGISAFDLSQQALQSPLSTVSSGPSTLRLAQDSTGLSTGLPYNYVTDLAMGQPGTRWENQVWIATGNKREHRYGVGVLLLNTQGTADPSDDTWTQFTKENTDDDGLPPWTGLASNNVTAIAINGDYVWFGTQPATWDAGEGVRGGEWTDGGLSVYDGERWTTRTDDNTGGQYAGMLDDRISALAIGCNGEIWIGLGNLR
ncbi:MAG: two-component regulator propeller domain-containing protein, partial [Anaerolineae bacterium]